MKQPLLSSIAGLTLAACAGATPNAPPVASTTAAEAPAPPSAMTVAPPPPPPPPASGATVTVRLENDVATGHNLTEFQRHRLLGHYSTYDGASGFILDRTVTPWKAKLDGVSTVVTLEVSNHPRRDITEYISADRSVWVRVNNDGTVEGFQGPKQHLGVDVVRDADANPLP